MVPAMSTQIRFLKATTHESVTYTAGQVAVLADDDARFLVVNGHAQLGDGPAQGPVSGGAIVPAVVNAWTAAAIADEASTVNAAVEAEIAEELVTYTTTAGLAVALDAALMTQIQSLDTLARRLAAYRTTQSDGLAAFSTTAGLTISGATIAATVGGTNGDGIVPLFARQARVSFRVTCTKATSGSRSTIGVTVSNPGVLPTAGNYCFTFGYKQGSGLCWVRDNVGADTVIVADASVTDGDQYDVTMFLDAAMSVAAAGSPTQAYCDVRYRKVGTTTEGWSNVGMNIAFYSPGNILLRTNVAAGALTNVSTAIPAAGELDSAPLASVSGLEYAYAATRESVMVWVPPAPNGLAVIACHGHGDGYVSAGWTSTKHRAVWNALAAAGYTIFVPTMGGNLWGNDTVMVMLAALHDNIVDHFGLDPRVFLWGDSMGGGAVLTAIGKSILPVRAAYVTEPVCNLSLMWSNPAYSSILTAYGSSTAERDDNDPLLQPTAAFTGIPIAFFASTGDTAVTKVGHTDAMRTKIAGVTTTALFTGTLSHADPEAYRPIDPVTWFAAHV